MVGTTADHLPVTASLAGALTDQAYAQRLVVTVDLPAFDGRGDIERRLLKAVDLSTFGEDSLRVLRALQFAARFDFDIAPATQALCAAQPLEERSRSLLTAASSATARSAARARSSGSGLEGFPV